MLLVCFLFRLHSSADVVAATVGFSEAVDFGKSSDKQHNYGVAWILGVISFWALMPFFVAGAVSIFVGLTWAPRKLERIMQKAGKQGNLSA